MTQLGPVSCTHACLNDMVLVVLKVGLGFTGPARPCVFGLPAQGDPNDYSHQRGEGAH